MTRKVILNILHLFKSIIFPQNILYGDIHLLAHSGQSKINSL